MSTNAELTRCVGLARKHLEEEHKDVSLDCRGENYLFGDECQASMLF